jgi:peroxiredoxin
VSIEGKVSWQALSKCCKLSMPLAEVKEFVKRALTQEKAAELAAKGVDAIACLSVNDVFVMGAWAKDQGVSDEIIMLADGSGNFAKAIGLEMDASKFGMGVRSQRFSLVADNGVVTHLFVEAPAEYKVSGAEYMLEHM